MNIGIVGLGPVGGFIAGCLAASGHSIRCLARPAVASEIRRSGIKSHNLDGKTVSVAGDKLDLIERIEDLGTVDAVLVCVKSRDTENIANLFATHLSQGITVVSIQNGIQNVARLRAHLPKNPVLGAMLPYTIKKISSNEFQRLMGGLIVIEDNASIVGIKLINALMEAGIEARLSCDILNFQWGKLIINTNNGLNGLLGIPLRDQLSDKKSRMLFAAVMDEALAVARAVGVDPAPSVGVNPWLLPEILRLPDQFYYERCGNLQKIGPGVRSSLWTDLENRCLTEVDDLNGEIARLARMLGVEANLNQKLTSLVKDAENRKQGSPNYSLTKLCSLLGLEESFNAPMED